MDEDELSARLTAFFRARSGDATAVVADVAPLPGHAGLSWGFTLWAAGTAERLVLRLPPPGVRWTGTADIPRQARIMRALAGSGVPVPAVRAFGDDAEPFGRPYFIAERLPGDTLRFLSPEGEQVLYLAPFLRAAAEQVTAALAHLHRLNPADVLPEPAILLVEEVTRWDWLAERNADPARTAGPALTALAPRVRERLLAAVPAARRASVCHGDYQWSNHLFDDDRLLAVLDWELANVGDGRTDLGWLAVFSDIESWAGLMRWEAPLPDADTVIRLYEQAAGERAAAMPWFRALAGYKFALITGMNVSLHRRGRRIDPYWEFIAPSAPALLERALEMLG